MKVVIIEDEENNVQLLKREILCYDENIKIIEVLKSVKTSIEFFNQQPDLDLIFMDIKLNDGFSFDIFSKTTISAPVIFVTAYNEYMVNAFRNNGIDYLLKPISEDAVRKSLEKYRKFKTHIIHKNLLSLFEQFTSVMPRKIVVKKGIEFHTVDVKEIAYFFVEQRIVFCVDHQNKKYITEWTNLGDATTSLDSNKFYRVNRKYIVSADFIKSYKSIEYGKTLLELNVKVPEDLIISQENSMHFRNWIKNIH